MSMMNRDRDEITAALGVRAPLALAACAARSNITVCRAWVQVIPLALDSKLLGPGNRPRLYWTNVFVPQIEDPSSSYCPFDSVLVGSGSAFLWKCPTIRRKNWWSRALDGTSRESLSPHDNIRVLERARRDGTLKTRHLSSKEVLSLMGLPTDYLREIAGEKTMDLEVRGVMLGNTFNVPTIEHCLSDYVRSFTMLPEEQRAEYRRQYWTSTDEWIHASQPRRLGAPFVKVSQRPTR